MVGKQIRQESQPGQADGGQNLGQDDAFAVTYFIHGFRADEVYHQLRQEKASGDHGQVCERDAIIPVEGEVQKRREIGGNGLRDESEIAGELGLFIVLSVLLHRMAASGANALYFVRSVYPVREGNVN